ncbi:protein psaF [Yersinia pestis]|nr:protein psaF [Yersinia pestis]
MYNSNVFLFLIYSFNDLFFYSEVKYGDIHEHLDLRMQGIRFSLSHYIIDDKSQLVISEGIYGIGLKMPTGKYYLFPLHSYQSSPDNMARGSLNSLASPLSLYVYEIHNKKNNVVTFFNGDRGFIDVNGETIHLSSLFLGVQGEHIHTSYHDVS